ncbi:hypothetical protein NUSPORA_02609 [Nucleospora cyclopteri]
MPRGGWELLRQTYCDKFSVLVSATEVKKFATNKRSNAELKMQENVVSETNSLKKQKQLSTQAILSPYFKPDSITRSNSFLTQKLKSLKKLRLLK